MIENENIFVQLNIVEDAYIDNIILLKDDKILTFLSEKMVVVANFLFRMRPMYVHFNVVEVFTVLWFNDYLQSFLHNRQLNGIRKLIVQFFIISFLLFLIF